LYIYFILKKEKNFLLELSYKLITLFYMNLLFTISNSSIHDKKPKN